MNDFPKTGDVVRNVLPGPLGGCLLALGGFLAWIVAGVLVALFIYPEDEQHFTLLGGVISVGQTWVVLFAVLRLGRLDASEIIGLKVLPGTGAQFALGAGLGGLGVAAAVLVIATAGHLQVLPSEAPPVSTTPEISAPLISGMVTLLLFSLSEEILARGFMYPVLKRAIGFVWALGISSAVFSLLHLLNPNFSVIPVVDIFLAGILLGLLRELTGNLYAAWGAHFGWNVFLALTGTPVSGILMRLEPEHWHFRFDGPEWLTGGPFGIEGGLGGIVGNVVMILIVTVFLSRKLGTKREET